MIVLVARYQGKAGQGEAIEAALLAHRETPYFKEIVEWTILPLLEKRKREFYTLAIG